MEVPRGWGGIRNGKERAYILSFALSKPERLQGPPCHLFTSEQGEKESLHLALRCQHQNNTAQATVSKIYNKEKERASI